MCQLWSNSLASDALFGEFFKAIRANDRSKAIQAKWFSSGALKLFGDRRDRSEPLCCIKVILVPFSKAVLLTKLFESRSVIGLTED